MPELPEVESIRRSLEPFIIGQTVLSVLLRRRDIVSSPHTARKADLLAGATITRIDRRGKRLAIIATSPSTGHPIALGVQLGMSGQLLRFAPRERTTDSTHVHALWRMSDQSRLLFRDPRRFGGLRVFTTLDLLTDNWGSLGPDALTMTDQDFNTALGHSSRAIKAALLDQSVIAGVGNIYADESLFRAKLAPQRPVAALSPQERATLASAIVAVLQEAVLAGGSTLRDYANANGESGRFQFAHNVYGRGGDPCPTCQRALRSAQLAQRTTVWCEHCQE